MIHDLLLRLAGRLPDDLITRARQWLADGQEGDLARAVAFGVLGHRVPITERDRDQLADLLAADGVDPAALAAAVLAEADPAPPYVFAAGAPEPADDIDRAAVDVVAGDARARGLWRVWRAPAQDTPWPPPRRVYLIEVDANSATAAPAALAASAQSALAEAGEAGPQVEVFPTGAALPAYQRLARGHGVLLWARTSPPRIRLAAAFDGADARTGPGFAASHPVVDDPGERRQVLDYLRAGSPLLVTTARMDDVVDRTRVGAVPMSFRTDGRWIWTDTTTYYLERHWLAPDPALLAHIRDARYAIPEVDDVAVHRAMAVLQGPPTQEPVWTVGGGSGARHD